MDLQCRAPSKMQQLRAECAERRAEEAAARIQRAKEHQEKLDRIRREVADALVGMGESESFGTAVAGHVSKRGSLLKLLDENGSLDTSRLQAFSQEVKLKWFEQKLMLVFPSWNL